MSVKIIGQRLIDQGGWYDFDQGLGCAWPNAAPGLEHWSGLGPHSTGGHVAPNRITEKVCLACGAAWFLPFLTRLQSGEPVSLNELERAHLEQIRKPMPEITNQLEFVDRFNSYVKAGGDPADLLGAYRVVRWDKEKQSWQDISST